MREVNQTSYSKITVDEINYMATEDLAGFVNKSEEYYNSQLSQVAQIIKNAKSTKHMILLCGPSSSGKTTTAHKLKKKLIGMGVETDVLSMDNFFLGIENYTLRPDGKPDMESVNTLDTELLNCCLRELLLEGKSNFPIFDFKAQSRLKELKEIKLSKNKVVIMEGIHALNPLLTQDIPKEGIFKMYVSVRTKFVENETSVLRPADIRLVRRMIRDTLFRGYSAKDTVEYWDHVLKSEKIYIDPYRDDVDFKMDTTIDYEVCIWHRLLHDVFTEGEWDQFKSHSFIVRIIEGLRKFVELPSEVIAKDSLLREFIG